MITGRAIQFLSLQKRKISFLWPGRNYSNQQKTPKFLLASKTDKENVFSKYTLHKKKRKKLAGSNRRTGHHEF